MSLSTLANEREHDALFTIFDFLSVYKCLNAKAYLPYVCSKQKKNSANPFIILFFIFCSLFKNQFNFYFHGMHISNVASCGRD